MGKNDSISEIKERLQKAENIAVFVHVSPDGDSVGSALGIGWALEDAGKKVQFVSQDPINSKFDFLYPEGKSPFVTKPTGQDCIILVDISSIDRAGSFFAQPESPQPDIVIDHHESNTYFGALNYVEPENPATAAMIAKIIPAVGLAITKRIADALLSGIVTDSLGFSTSNVNTELLMTATVLMNHGAVLSRIMKKVYMQHSFEALRFWSYGMKTIERRGNLLWAVLTAEARKESGYTYSDDAEFANFVKNIEGADVSVVFNEHEDNTVKVSWRAVDGFDVQKVAVSMGGGGHVAAAGATVTGSLDEAIPKVIAQTTKILGL